MSGGRPLLQSSVHRPSSIVHRPLPSPALSRIGLDDPRCEHLLENFDRVEDALKRRRAAEIPETGIDDYIRLTWLCWNAGRLDLTQVGQNVSTLMHLHRPADRDDKGLS
jgi:hypothetical protein